MQNRTRLALVWLFAMSIIAALALGGAERAEAQSANAVVRVEVRYPNGELVEDTLVCSLASPTRLNTPELPQQYTNATFHQAGHRLNTPSGPISEISVPGGGQYVVSAYSCPVVGDGFMSAYNFGPQGPWGVGSNHLALSSISLAPGDRTTVVLTVGRGQITGRFDGLNSCGISVFGVPDFGDQKERQFGRAGAPSPGSSYFAPVPPGRYRVQADCGGVTLHYPPGSTADTARYFQVAHGQTITGVDFPSVTDPIDVDNASFQVADSSRFLSFCADTFLADGTLSHSSWVGEAFHRDREEHLAFAYIPNSIYRIRITDCTALGFDDFWYPNVQTIDDAEWLIPGEDLTEVVDILGTGGPRCNGQVPTILGNFAPNILIGTEGADVIVGGGGDDVISGLGGDDVICSGDGSDRILGNAGADWIDAGPGNDWVGAGWGDDTVFGGAGNDFIRGFRHNDTIYGGTGNDRITGGWGNDILRGGSGSDTIRAYFGADRLFGDAGNDALVGGGGPDVLVGGPGPADKLFGDDGRDVCNDVGVAARFEDCELINGA